MKLEEALQFANELKIIRPKNACFVGEYTITYVADVAIALADEVRRLRVPAVEAVPLGYASTDLDGVPNKDGHDLIVKDAPFYCSDKQDCIPLYTHPPTLDGDTRKLVLELCNMFEQFGYMPSQGMELIGEIREKLGASDDQ